MDAEHCLWCSQDLCNGIVLNRPNSAGENSAGGKSQLLWPRYIGNSVTRTK